MSDIVYYNLTIGTNSTGLVASNNDYTASPASIVAQNTLPILDDPSQYYGSVVRLNIPQFEIPVAYFDVATDSSGNVPDIDEGIYQFTLAWGSLATDGTRTIVVEDTQSCRWVQQDFNAYPIPVNGAKLTPSNYYFIYDYETMINTWNVALKTAFDNLITSGLAPLLATGQEPFFYYDPNTQKISLYSVQSTSEFGFGTDFLQIYCNGVMENFIHGFKFLYFTDAVKSILFNVQSYPKITSPLNVSPLPDSSGNPDPSGIPYIKVQQEYVSLNYWNMLRNIYITTTMPVQQEGYYIGSLNNNLGQNLILQSTLTDYIPDLTQGGQAGVAGAQFIYNANALWRIFQLNSNVPLMNISAAIFFTDQNGYSWPLTLFVKQPCNIKFMFIKKHLISNLFKGKV